MIRVRIQEVAKSRGILTAYQLEQATGWPPSMAAGIWKGDWTHSYLKTLNTLCNVLKCTPNDLLDFTPDDDIIVE